MKLMKPAIALTIALLAAALAADAAPTNQAADVIAKLRETREAEMRRLATTAQVTEAIAKLKAVANYSWTCTLKAVDSGFDIGPVKGQAGQDGFARMSQDINGNSIEIVLKADNVAFKGQDGWQIISNSADREASLAADLARNGAAAREAEITLGYVNELKALDGGAWEGDLTTNGAADLMSFGPRGHSAENGFPPPKNAKGSVKFWVKDGLLVKYETHLHGTFAFVDIENEMDESRSVEIQDVGTTKMDIPAEVRTKLEAVIVRAPLLAGGRGGAPGNASAFGGMLPGDTGLDGIKSQIRATDEEWKIIAPVLQSVITLRQTANEGLSGAQGDMGFGDMMGGFGGFGGGFGFGASDSFADPGGPGGFWGGGPGGSGGGGSGGSGGGGSPVMGGGQNAVALALTELRTALSTTNTAAEIKEQVAAVRTARQKARTDLAAAEKKLRSLLTADQEAVLVGLGYLE
jgi:hypothetical protein